MHPLLRTAAEKQFGLFTAVDARRAGYGHDEIRALRSSGQWVRLRRGVCTTAGRPPGRTGSGHAVEGLAVLLALDRPTAVLSHTSAARLSGLPVRAGAEDGVRLTDPARWRSGHGFRMVRAPLGPADVVQAGPLRLTSVARTLVDCSREWELVDAVVALDAALLDDRTSPAELRGVLASQPQWPGAPRARRAVALADGRAESPLRHGDACA